MKACELCEYTDKEKRSGICATCNQNCTYANHMKVSKQVSRLMEEYGISPDDLLKSKE